MEVKEMKIDSVNEMKPKENGPDQKKEQLKRKRSDPSLCTSPEEKQAKMDSFRNEINNLIKFCKDLIFKNRGTLVENVDNIGLSSVSLNAVIACLMEESDLPLSKLVDEISEKIKGRFGNCDSVTKATVKSAVLTIGQRLCYGVASVDADLLEDDAEGALWCWEIRDLKLMPKLVRSSVKVGRICRKKIHERITAVLAMLSALEKSDDRQNRQQELIKALEKLDKVLNEADIRSLMENLSQKNSAEMAEKEAMKEQKLLIKQMEKNKREMEKDRKKMERELQKEKMQSEKELKRLHAEAEKEVKCQEKEECEMQKQLKRQREETEKDHKRKEKEEAELKRQLSLQKQASLMERFLKKNKTTTQPESSMNKATTSELSSNNLERKCETATVEMDSVLAQNVGFEAEAIWKSHLNSWRSIRSNRNVHWGIRQKPKTELIKELKLTTDRELACDEDLDVEKLVDGWVDSKIDGRLSQMDIDRPLANSQKGTRSKQLVQFDKSYRPAFYGVWPRKSQVVGARCPLAKDPDVDYEIDSDEEWEEDEPGESLSDCDKGEEDESAEGHLEGDDEDESEDGFFVPDGYLSENEGIQADELVKEVRKLSDSENQTQSEEFCTLLRQQKYLNNMTEQALQKNQPFIILNLTHEKITLLPAEELTGTEKFERMCLQTLGIRPLLDFASMDISTHSDVVNVDLEASSNKSSTAPATMPDSDLPWIISTIHSCPHSIGKIVESLHDVFPALPKSQLRNKVREISEFSENRWQVKKDILSQLGLSKSPEKKCMKTKSIATFFSKRCLPPSGNTINFSL